MLSTQKFRNEKAPSLFAVFPHLYLDNGDGVRYGLLSEKHSVLKRGSQEIKQVIQWLQVEPNHLSNLRKGVHAADSSAFMCSYNITKTIGLL